MSTEFRTNTITSANELGYQLHDGIDSPQQSNKQEQRSASRSFRDHSTVYIVY